MTKLTRTFSFTAKSDLLLDEISKHDSRPRSAEIRWIIKQRALQLLEELTDPVQLKRLQDAVGAFETEKNGRMDPNTPDPIYVEIAESDPDIDADIDAEIDQDPETETETEPEDMDWIGEEVGKAKDERRLTERAAAKLAPNERLQAEIDIMLGRGKTG